MNLIPLDRMELEDARKLDYKRRLFLETRKARVKVLWMIIKLVVGDLTDAKRRNWERYVTLINACDGDLSRVSKVTKHPKVIEVSVEFRNALEHAGVKVDDRKPLNLLLSEIWELEYAFDQLEGKGFFSTSFHGNTTVDLGYLRKLAKKRDPALGKNFGMTAYGSAGYHRYHVYEGGRLVYDAYYGREHAELARALGFEVRD